MSNENAQATFTTADEQALRDLLIAKGVLRRRGPEEAQLTLAGEISLLPGTSQQIGVEVTDTMALAFHHALTDGSIGQHEVDEIKLGLRAALNAAPQPTPQAPQEVSHFQHSAAADFCRANGLAAQDTPTGCGHCNHPLFCGTSCGVCGKRFEYTPVQGEVAELLDWIGRQGPEFGTGILQDQPGDGEYFVDGIGCTGRGKTFIEALRAARLDDYYRKVSAANAKVAELEHKLHAAKQDAHGARECHAQDAKALTWWRDQFSSMNGVEKQRVADRLKELVEERDELRVQQIEYVDKSAQQQDRIAELQARLSAIDAQPVIGWVTRESLARLKRGGNGSRGSVPIHSQRSAVAKTPVFVKQ